jgi:hypothetical protein
VHRTLPIALAAVLALALAGCSGASVSVRSVPAHTVSDAAVCRIVNELASPLAQNSSRDEAWLRQLGSSATDAEDADFRPVGQALTREVRSFPRNPNADPDLTSKEIDEARGGAFSRIASVCVSKGLVPKDWMGLA